MNMDEKEIEKSTPDFEEAEQEQPVSALDAINASFNQKTREKEMPAKERAARQKSEEPRDSGNPERKWNIITGVLVTVIIAVAILIVLTLRRQAQEANQIPADPVQSGNVQVSGESGKKPDSENGTEQPPMTHKESETEQSSETKKLQETEPKTEKALQTTESSSGKETEVSEKTQGGETTEIPEQYKAILTAEEQKDWQERKKDSSKIFVQLNRKITISDQEQVYLRLINPPYSVYTVKIKIYLNEDPENILYQSENVEPGTIVEYVSFSGSVPQGSHPATVLYTVYDTSGNEIGDHPQSITIDGQ